MPEQKVLLSAELLAAQQRLTQLRHQRRLERIAEGLPVSTDSQGRPLLDLQLPIDDLLLPVHLGWESVAVTAVLHKKQLPIEHRQVVNKAEIFCDAPSSPGKPQLKTIKRTEIRLYPTLALAMLRQEQVATGRIWLLLRHLDEKGKGWLDVAEAKQNLTKQDSLLRVCGWRNLRVLLAQGNGTFWEVQNGRVWLYSISKVAAHLGVHRLQGRPITLPLLVLTQTIGMVRAHFYASFHSGRNRTPVKPDKLTFLYQDKCSQPIARATLKEISGVSPRSQRRYDIWANVQKRSNFAIGDKASTENQQSCAWQQGQAMFQLTDHKGKQGAAGTCYIAWQLPNSYTGPHQRLSKSHQKYINYQLVDLLNQGTTGNGRYQVEKRFYDHGAAAAKAFNQSAKQDIYWHREASIWHVIKQLEPLSHEPASYLPGKN